MGNQRSLPLERPTQAVILAGGRGTRLKPLTDTRPKPMVEILGEPFLAYQIEQLRDQGFEKVLLLLGYLPEVVQDYCGNGNRWGIKIEYAISAVDDETGRRLKLAESLLDPSFLLLYCDNYWPMQMEKMWPRFIASGAPAMITVYTNKDGYTRSSVRVGPDGYVEVYDKTCATPGLQGVEISYALVIADENGAAQIQIQIVLRLKEQSRLRLAAFAAIVPAVWAIVNRVDMTARLFRILLHSFMNVLEICLSHGSTPNACLIGNNNDAIAVLFEQTQSFLGSRKPFKFVPAPNVLGFWRSFVEYSVSIENNGGPAPKEGFSQRQPV